MSGHGTYSRYQDGCRCDPCVEANRAYHRNYRQRVGLSRQMDLEKIRQRAMRRLRDAHRDEYEQYLREERIEAGLRVQGYDHDPKAA